MTAVLERPVETVPTPAIVPVLDVPIQRVTADLLFRQKACVQFEDFAREYPHGWVPSLRSLPKVERLFTLADIAYGIFTPEGMRLYREGKDAFQRVLMEAEGAAWEQVSPYDKTGRRRYSYSEQDRLFEEMMLSARKTYVEKMQQLFLKMWKEHALIRPSTDPLTQKKPTAEELATPASVPLRKVTEAILKHRGACEDRFTFANRWPDGLVPATDETEDLGEEIGRTMNLFWCGDALLSPRGQTLWRKHASHYREARHDKVSAANHKFNHVGNTTRNQYTTMVKRADETYHKQIGKLFLKLFKQYPIHILRAVASPEDLLGSEVI